MSDDGTAAEAAVSAGPPIPGMRLVEPLHVHPGARMLGGPYVIDRVLTGHEIKALNEWAESVYGVRFQARPQPRGHKRAERRRLRMSLPAHRR